MSHTESTTNGESDERRQVKVDPFLRWAGSKRQLLSQLAEFWKPGYTRYVEPFAGCAALFFRLKPHRAILGDLNADLMEAYGVVRDSPDAVHKALASFPRTSAFYYRMRERQPSALSGFDRAVRFVFLNRCCFNGIYRTNAAGVFNVPYGGDKSSAIPPVETFRKCASLLKGATLRHSDFGHVLRDTRRGDLVYLDPPYALDARRVFREYGAREFDITDLDRLSDHLSRLNRRGVHFVVSYADSSEARHAFKNWQTTRVRVKRHIAGFTASRRNAYELIATNTSKAHR